MHPHEFIERAHQLILRDADAGIPHLDHHAVTAHPTAEEYAPAIGIAELIPQEIAQDARQQRRVRPYCQVATLD